MINLTEKQQEIIHNPARVKLVMGGQRSGKTVLAITNMWEEMKRSASYPRVLFLTPADRFQKLAVREIMSILPIEEIISKELHQDTDGGFFLIKTTRGEIFVSDHFICMSYDGIVFDNATSSKYLSPEILERRESLYLTGHCPDDMNNAFFLMWLKAYFADNPDVKAFHLNTWNNPAMLDIKNEREENLREKMGKQRYNRSYLCIPDFLDCVEPKPNIWTKREYLNRTINLIERDEVKFDRRYLGKW
jgi:hypothetical protein